MTSFPHSPKLAKAGLVLIDAASSALVRVIALQYNPDSLSRTLQVRGAGDGAQRSDALRLTGPAVETIKLEAEIDATDRLESPGRNPATVEHGILPDLAALESLVYPRSETLSSNNARAAAGSLEIAPMEAPLVLFVWSKSRVVPVRITDFSITEEAFDPALHPIRAKVSIGLRVLSVDDLGFAHRGGSIFMSHLRSKEGLAAKAPGAGIGTLGLENLP
jgi:hypothetical protein